MYLNVSFSLVSQSRLPGNENETVSFAPLVTNRIGRVKKNCNVKKKGVTMKKSLSCIHPNPNFKQHSAIK